MFDMNLTRKFTILNLKQEPSIQSLSEEECIITYGGSLSYKIGGFALVFISFFMFGYGIAGTKNAQDQSIETARSNAIKKEQQRLEPIITRFKTRFKTQINEDPVLNLPTVKEDILKLVDNFKV